MKEAATLSRNESQIAEMIAWGASKKDISNVLYISVRTVESHTRTIFKKTGCTKSNELSAWWFCTKFKISFDLSPLKRKLIVACLVLILSAHEFAFQSTSVRAFRSGKSLPEQVSGRNTRKDDFINPFEEYDNEG